MKIFQLTLTAVAFAACAVAATAQQQPSTPSTTVGVTPNAAAEANDKAVPRNDVGTVVRTGPSAADKARAATDGANPSTNATATDRDAVGNQPVRRPIADRN